MKEREYVGPVGGGGGSVVRIDRVVTSQSHVPIDRIALSLFLSLSRYIC